MIMTDRHNASNFERIAVALENIDETLEEIRDAVVSVGKTQRQILKCLRVTNTLAEPTKKEPGQDAPAPVGSTSEITD
jgi:hypothetical protein